ncbi:nonsense-mediated mRNA decay factor SMG5-like [Antechinus flavipes]|uniref:nonsense-mediated mRNA decay factor SMG5-like n=1 Tax=Antechinus flavipes TaxID=38775 RepID=UPI0022369E0A|nr:nonsense-mediated mRNA decay factor SMG5-like [Antechinus flavipes]
MSSVIQDASLHKEDLVARQLYQKALKLGQQLNITLSKSSNTNQDVFKPYSLTLRNRIEQLCIKIMFLNPVQYGEKAEELLWINVYYNIILLMFKNRIHHVNVSDVDLKTHLEKGIMFYQNLLFFLQEHYELQPESNGTHRNIIDCRRVVLASEKEVEWARMACYRCLLYLGDLFLFRSRIRCRNFKQLAINHYFQALSMAPHMGSPYNRLANVTGDNYYHISAAFFYQCSIQSEVPARDASFYLRSLYVKAVEMYNQMMTSSGQERCEPNKRLLVSFLYLQNFLQPDSCMDPRLALLSQSILEDFRLYLSSEIKGEHKNGFSLPDHVIFHMVTLCIMSVYSLKKAVGVSQSRAAITFILVLLSHLVHHMNISIQSELDGVNVQKKKSAFLAHDFDLSASLDNSQYASSPEGSYDYISGASENDSDQSHISLDKNDDWEEEIFRFSSFTSDSSMENGVSPPLILDKHLELRDSSRSQALLRGSHKFQTSQNTLRKSCSEFRAVTSKKHLECDKLRNTRKRGLSRKAYLKGKLRKKLCCFATQKLFYTIKVFLDWLWIDPDLTLECTHSSPRLWSHLAVLLNLLPTIEEYQEAHLSLSSHIWDLVLISEKSDLPISLLLPEDSRICNLLPMKAARKSICFMQVPPLLDPLEKGVLYTCFLRSFGHFAAQLDDSLLRFFPSLGIFRSIVSTKCPLKRQNKASLNILVKKTATQQLFYPELSFVYAERQFPLYLVPDTQALCQYVPIIQELIMNDSFIVIISSIVIDELIFLKHKEPGACAVISLLMDKMKEKSHLCFQTNAGKEDVKSSMNRENPEASDLNKILEQCKDLVRGPKSDVNDRSHRMNILTSIIVNNPNTFCHPLLSDFQTSASISVEIKHILQFYREWKMIKMLNLWQIVNIKYFVTDLSLTVIHLRLILISSSENASGDSSSIGTSDQSDLQEYVQIEKKSVDTTLELKRPEAKRPDPRGAAGTECSGGEVPQKAEDETTVERPYSE